MVTFSGLLNAMDGVTSSEERIVFMTTNHLNRLDPALIRPGRVDIKIKIDNVTEYQIKQLFLRFYENQDALALEFLESVQKHGLLGKLSAAQIQGHFVIYRNDPKGAIQNVMNCCS